MFNEIKLGNALDVLRCLGTNSIPMIYIDPPFNTGKTQSLQSLKGGVPVKQKYSYSDSFLDYERWLTEHLDEAHRVLAENGTMYVHLDYREVHYIKVALDNIFGRQNFLNEIIWAYDYGARTKVKWPTKHDTILVYVKDVNNYVFNYDAIDRIPYMAPGLQTPERAELGKTPTDTWWMSIVPTNGKERTGYATQKPIGLLRRMILASSNPGDTVLDFFAGSGTTGAAAKELGRHYLLVDSNPDAVEVMRKRLEG